MEWEKKLGTVSRVLQCYILAASRVKCGGLSLEIAPVKLEVMPAPPTHEANIGKALRVFFGHRDLLRRRVCQYRMGETSFFFAIRAQELECIWNRVQYIAGEHNEYILRYKFVCLLML